MNRFFSRNLRANLDGLPGRQGMRARLRNMVVKLRYPGGIRFELENSRGKKPHYLRSYVEVWW